MISIYLLITLICFKDTETRRHINTELKNVNRWLCSNKLSLNIEKSSYVVFHPSQKNITDDFNLIIDDVCLKKEKFIKYLGVIIESNLSWKPQVGCISKKLKRSLGVLSKIRYYVDINILISLHYALIYPFFDIWHNCLGQHVLNNPETSLCLTEKSTASHNILKIY